MSFDSDDEVIDTPFEIENQILLRLPSTVADYLRNAVECDTNLKNRLKIELEDDLRNGTLRFDGLTLPFKVVDLPTIIESLKTTDGKTFYKTADVCQMMICKEDVQKEPTDGQAKESRKKYCSSHGISAPLKNVKSKRFRKTVMKKNLDLYEIEKEVRRLLRTDNEAVKVRYELIDIDDAKNSLKLTLSTNSSKIVDIEEHELFGGELSSSEDENSIMRPIERVNSSSSVTFRSQIESLNSDIPLTKVSTVALDENQDSSSLSNFESLFSDMADISIDATDSEMSCSTSKEPKYRNENLLEKLSKLTEDIGELNLKITAQESVVQTIDNFMLKQRLMNEIGEMKSREAELQCQQTEIVKLLN